MPQEVPDLSREERARIVDVITQWAEVHPKWYYPIVHLLDGQVITPRDMARALSEPESSLGRYLFRVFAAGLIEDEFEASESLDDILRDFVMDIERWTGRSLDR